jgi:hypothetical protein
MKGRKISPGMNLELEVTESLRSGGKQLTMAALKAEVESLGYRINRDMRAVGVAKNMTTGNTYQSVTFGLDEADTGRSAFHFESRRDGNFKALQELRRRSFVVSRGAMVTV